jgi:cobalt-zinc-cadmium efflux system membrane fusion protein
MKKRRIITLLLFTFLLTACNQGEQQKDETANPDAVKAHQGLFLSSKQLANTGITYGSISLKQLSSDVNARGQLVLPVNGIADIVSHYPGIINKVMVRTGDKIAKGDLLASLASAEYIDAQQHYLMVKSQLEMLEQEYERQKELNKDKIASDKYYQKAESNYMVAMAEMEGLGLQLEMAGTNLSKLSDGDISSELLLISPIKGHVENINANPGKYIMQDERVMSVINRDKLLVELNVFEKDILKIMPAQRVTFSLSNLGKEVYEAKVISIGNIVREENRVVKVLAEFNNRQDRMLPGMFVAAEIHTGENDVEALPEEAVVRIDRNEHIIYYTTPALQMDEGTYFMMVRVATGFVEDGYIQVFLEEKIPDDAMIVVAGAYFLKTEMAKKAE